MTAPIRKIQNWVLIRGLVRSQYHWKDFPIQLEKSAPDVKVHLVEISGNGFLYQFNTPTDIVEAVELLQAQLPENLESFGLIGISLGGMLATKWAQMQPEKVQELVLINSSSGLSPFYDRLMPSNYGGVLGSLFSPSFEKKEELILSMTVNQEEIWRRQLAENVEFLKQHPVSIRNFINQLRLTSQVNFKDVPPCAKLVLNSKADRLVNPSCSERIAEAWQCPLMTHESAGHDLPLDDAEWVIQKINQTFQTAN